jgi:hypothetical protein
MGEVEDVEQRLGPFRIGGRNFAVVLHLKRLAPAPSGRVRIADISPPPGADVGYPRLGG